MARAENAHRADESVPAASSSPWPHTGQEAETEDIVHALATVRGLALLQVSNGTSRRALARHWQHTREHLLRVLG